jgi:ADP-ribosylation factor-like protein 8
MTTICDRIKSLFSDFYKKLFITEFRILVLGLNGSSKSSLIDTVFKDRYIKHSSNKEVTVNECISDGIKFLVYDIKGDRKYRRKWDYMYRKCDVLLYCVDLSAIQEVWEESKYELQQLLCRNSRKKKNMLVLGTKNDKGRAKEVYDMIITLGLVSIIDIEIACISVSAKESTNVELVMPWLIEQYQIKHMNSKLKLF